MDYRERYKPLLVKKAYTVVEELSGKIVAPAPLSYDEALKIADRENAAKAERVVAALGSVA